ncbi:hypothetical protein TraAM80_03334 [Trypanosoma rangeli]|uniref:PSI domain-containing protein n=1 Tax=Trypanosoma rangeli TaxID=5698 RepID=A0A422NPH9_TRYRA|nr:uncharacterized protein TraAM80_03334 [Trypanosoma rangeli]RNF07365.1 hypothetical protein TraAM80_03334 [Trypanosoma rangeli]|eukprot:RNF07365.1 hypothetical protein TraAM80_03334 [Trypanosoma rangeli]
MTVAVAGMMMALVAVVSCVGGGGLTLPVAAVPGIPSGIPAVTGAGAMDACAAYTSCAECVFDASDGILNPPLDCAWCVSTHRCIRFNTSALPPSSSLPLLPSHAATAMAGTCPDLRHARLNPTCPDMSCAAANTTNNIYICRPITILWITLACLLGLLDVAFYLWLHAVRQLPWKYEPHLSQLLAGAPHALGGLQETNTQAGTEQGTDATTEVPMETQAKQINHNPDNRNGNECRDEHSADGESHNQQKQQQQQQQQQRVPSNCPICKMTQPAPPSPGDVCFWCNIARFGFVPLFIGISSAVLGFILLFCVSLKPWFADGFYIYLILSAYVSYAIFGAHVYFGRTPQLQPQAVRETLYVQLAIRLLGRPLLSVIPALSEGEAASPVLLRASSLSPSTQSPHGGGGAGTLVLEGNTLSPELVRQKKGETAQLLNMEGLEQGFRKVLLQTLARDEYVLWCEKPEVSSIIFNDLWLYIDLSAGVAFGIWLAVASSVKDPTYVLVRLFGSTTMGVLGFLLIVAFTLLLTMTLSSSIRLYALTDRRLLTVFNGLISPTVAETELKSLRFASVYGYKFFGNTPVLTFSWEVPLTERKMPPIKSHNFPAVLHLEEFLKYFKAVAPTFTPINNQSHQSMQHKRQAWRMHLFFAIVLLHFLPIITLYPLFLPGFLSFLLFIIFGFVVLAIVHRGVQVQRMTHASLSLAGNWSPAGAQFCRRERGLFQFFRDDNSLILRSKARASTVTST